MASMIPRENRIDKDLQDRARLIYVPLGYNTAYSVIQAINSGIEERFSTDEIALIQEADDNMWGIKAVSTAEVTPLGENDWQRAMTTVQPYKFGAGESEGVGVMKRSPINISSVMMQARDIYKDKGFISLKEAYCHADTDKLFTRQERSDIIDAYYALTTDTVDLTAISTETTRDVYIQFARETAKKFDYPSVKETVKNITAIEPQLNAKEIAQLKVGWQIISNEREIRRKKNEKPVTVTTNTSTAMIPLDKTTTDRLSQWRNRTQGPRVVRYPYDNKSVYRSSYQDWGDDDYGYNYGRQQWNSLSTKTAETWQSMTANYMAARNSGDVEVFIGTQDLPETVTAVSIVEGEVIVQDVERMEQLDIADDAITLAAHGAAEIDAAIKKLIAALGFKNPASLSAGTQGEVVGEMLEGIASNAASQNAASALVLAYRELQGMRYHFMRLEEFVTQESALVERATLNDEMAQLERDTEEIEVMTGKIASVVDNGGTIVYTVGEESNGIRNNESVEEFLVRVRNRDV